MQKDLLQLLVFAHYYAFKLNDFFLLLFDGVEIPVDLVLNHVLGFYWFMLLSKILKLLIMLALLGLLFEKKVINLVVFSQQGGL